jgi:hypothetical protein
MKKLGILLLGVMLLAPQVVAGQQYAPALQDQSLFQYTFVAGSGVGNVNGYQVGPYVGRVGWNMPTAPTFSLYCVDYANSIASGNQINAFVSNIGGGDVSGTRLGIQGPVSSTYGTALERYQKAAWLAAKYFDVGMPGTWPAIQAAIWTIMTPDFVLYNPTNTAFLATVEGLLGQVTVSGWTPAGVDLNRWSVLTPYDEYGRPILAKQEMLVQSVVPEPQTYILMATGLIFMVFFGRRRMKEMGYI